jgi:hypothetical protein
MTTKKKEPEVKEPVKQAKLKKNGEPDKRSQTSGKNLSLARATVLKAIRKTFKPEEVDSDFQTDTESESEPEEYETKPITPRLKKQFIEPELEPQPNQITTVKEPDHNTTPADSTVPDAEIPSAEDLHAVWSKKLRSHDDKHNKKLAETQVEYESRIAQISKQLEDKEQEFAKIKSNKLSYMRGQLLSKAKILF